ncbi:putative ankyrin repeat protein RF_0381 [Liolophura sinensis]|uniref:putative ankyrin repeat protein RF_0381 n=1 Tax=Liolophura sinensis TaxID=3198878 RepID=UPI003158B7B5
MKMPRVCRVKQLPESFFEAIEENDSSTISRYISDGIDLNGRRGYRTEYGTPLTVAVGAQNFNTVVSFIAQGAKVNQPGTVWGAMPLHVAAKQGNLNIVKLLIDAGADVNMLDRSKSSPLTVACGKGNLDVAKYLLCRGACVNHQAGYEVVPLEARKLLGTEDDLTEQQREDILDPFKGNTPLTKATWSGNIDLVRELLQNGSDVMAETYAGNTALHVAAREGHVDILRLLIGCYETLDVKNAKGEIPLFMAVRKFFDCPSGGQAYVQIVEELLQIGSNVATKTTSDENVLFAILTSNFRRPTNSCELIRWNLLMKVLAATRTLSPADLPSETKLSEQLLSAFGNPLPWLIAMAKSPRSLQHLCRLTIWDTLPTANSAHVRKLPITATMKAYLTLN